MKQSRLPAGLEGERPRWKHGMRWRDNDAGSASRFSLGKADAKPSKIVSTFRTVCHRKSLERDRENSET